MALTDQKTFAQVESELKQLPLGEYYLTDIVNIISQCDTFKSKTTDAFTGITYDDDTESLAELKDLKVDLNYQRKLKIKTLLKNLRQSEGFSKEKAGHIDVAIRQGGEQYVWDGFRRCIKALLCNMKKIAMSEYRHPKRKSPEDCRKYEAELFLYRNGKHEPMGTNELFFARYAMGDEEARKLKSVLDRANINVCGLRPGGRSVNGFTFYEKALAYQERFDDNKPINKLVSDDNFVYASTLLADVYKKGTLSAYIIVALANVRQILQDDLESDFIDDDIKTSLTAYALNKDKTIKNKMAVLLENQLKNKPLESVTYNILKGVMKMNGRCRKLSGLTVDEEKYLKELDEE
tara:strand:- start:50 stop:1096 length:1047 start_codon:yes stop_codon:yes gene_type:complete